MGSPLALPGAATLSLYPPGAFPTPNPSPNNSYSIQSVQPKSEPTPTSRFYAPGYSFAPAVTATDLKVSAAQSEAMSTNPLPVAMLPIVSAQAQDMSAHMVDDKGGDPMSPDSDSHDYTSNESHDGENEAIQTKDVLAKSAAVIQLPQVTS